MSLRPLFKLKTGDCYSQKQDPQGLPEGAGALRLGRLLRVHRLSRTGRARGPGGGDAPASGEAATPPTTRRTAASAQRRSSPPIVDVTMRMQEGKQYFVNRITFVGNTTTRDNVIRRELRLYENDVFNTRRCRTASAASTSSATSRRSRAPAKTSWSTRPPGQDNKLDVALKLEEQNRNQLTFGAGVSQFEGFFGQLSFQTANFLGPRREPHRLAPGRAARAELHARVHRAVPVRPQHHRRRQPVQAGIPLHQPVHAEVRAAAR